MKICSFIMKYIAFQSIQCQRSGYGDKKYDIPHLMNGLFHVSEPKQNPVREIIIHENCPI